ncbi:MAG TPA: FAD-dependent oxidoreductase [Chiayiivirga sp.]|nr:FAD-dependent oxidoreductase [Chiayiivirga sp.]
MHHHFDHLILGAGMAAEAAAQALAETDPSASIGMIGAEKHPPYNRPPLSKALWKDAGENSIWRPIAASGAQLFLGRRATAIDADAHTVTDDRGETYRYGKLLFATGGSARRLPFEGDRILAYRTLDDYHRLLALAEKEARIVVIGGGFVGSEIAAALVGHGCRVTMVFPEPMLGARAYPADLCRFIENYYRDRGIDVRTGRMVKDGTQEGNTVRLALDDGSALEADAVVAGLGIIPETTLAEAAGAQVNNGIVVDECMRTTVFDLFAAGDVANFPSQALGRRRVEHEDTALSTGRIAGLAMAGKPEPYAGLPFFYSDLFDLGYEAVGTLDSRLEIFEDWVEPHREGVLYYLDQGRVRGVLLWNTWGRIDAARALIHEAGPHSASTLRGRIRG